MLAACRAKLGPADGGRVHLQDARALDLPRQYAHVFCGAGSFGLLPHDDDVAAALAGIRDTLLPGGTVLLEVETAGATDRPGA